MGREIRRVPPNWEHPREKCTRSFCLNCKGSHYTPLYDQDYDSAAQDWLEGLREWENNPHRLEGYRYYWDYEGPPPTEESYRPKWTVEPTWYQVYETVSEGTPVTPPFATKEELAQYLAKHGDYWYQHKQFGGTKPTIEQARAFVDEGWAPTMTITRTGTTFTLEDFYQSPLNDKE